MERDGDATFAVDLLVDVLVRADLRSIQVGDEAEFEQALSVALVSPAEGEQAPLDAFLMEGSLAWTAIGHQTAQECDVDWAEINAEAAHYEATGQPSHSILGAV